MLKRISAIGLAIVIVLGMIFSGSPVVLATESDETHYAYYENGVFHYQIIEGTAKITKASISTEHMDIKFPSEVDGIPVTAIGSNVNDWQRTSPYTWINVEIPEGITTIEESAFTYASIYSLKLPSSITSIGDRAFKGNAIGNVKIASMEAWSKINFGEDGANPLFAGATLRCNNQIVTEYTFSEEIKNIQSRVFQGCASIESITIPNHIESIGDSAFEDCENLMQVNIEAGVASVGNTCFKGCTSLISIQIPESVVSMGDATFEECNSLSTVKLSTNIKHINEKMFCGCTVLEEIEMADDIQSIGTEAFRDSGSLEGLKISNSVISIGEAAFQNSRIASVEWPDNITTIKENTFAGCQALESITMSSVITIEQFAFFGSGLERITLPETVQYIGNHAIPSEGCIIYGWVNSYAQTYATSNSIQFEAITFPVIYDANGGYNAPQQQQKKAGEDLQLTNDVPEKEEHAFLGWATTSDGVVEHMPGDVYTNNCPIILYAVWDAGYTVTYHINDGTNELVTQKKYHGEILQLKNPTRTGYTFKGWSTESTGDALYQPGENYEKDEDITLYAVWIKTYFVTYDTAGGSGTINTQYFEVNETVQISETIPLRIGYVFLGWSENSSGEVNFQPGDIYSQNKDVTLYAVWAPSYTVTYDANGGYGAPDSQIQRKGEAIILANTIPYKSQHVFLGWSTSRDGKVLYANGATYREESDVTLYAQWGNFECLECNGDGVIQEQCGECKGNGTIKESSICVKCSGTGKELIAIDNWSTCQICNGNNLNCANCDGKGKVYTPEYLRVPCSQCNETGVSYDYTKCPTCLGEGEVSWECNQCNNGSMQEIFSIQYCIDRENIFLTQTKYENIAFAISYEAPVHSGVLFLGWATSPDGMVEYYPGDTYLENKDLQLYAVWSAPIPSAPIVSSYTDTKVVLIPLAGGEYSLDGVNWQKSNVFENLSPSTGYTFYQRYAKTDTNVASVASRGISVTTDKSKQTLIPNAPVVQSITVNSITLVAVDGCEYSKDGIIWQSSPVFDGLSCGTKYIFYQRYKETADTYAGNKSNSLIVKTDKGTQSAPSQPTLIGKTYDTVTLTLLSGYEYSVDGNNWQLSNVFTGLNPETNYLFYQRKAETDTHYASGASTSLTVKTAEEPTYIVGDLDGDFELSDWDGVMLARYLAGWQVEISALEALDIDGDGEVSDWDGVVLDRYLAGWNIQIGGQL